MARVAMVTRTITTSEVEVLCMNVETVGVETKIFTLLGGVSTADLMLKAIKSKYETETLKPVHIQNMTEIETLYGMTEEEFIKLAKILPPRGSVPAGDGITDDTQALQEHLDTTEPDEESLYPSILEIPEVNKKKRNK